MDCDPEKKLNFKIKYSKMGETPLESLNVNGVLPI